MNNPMKKIPRVLAALAFTALAASAAVAFGDCARGTRTSEALNSGTTERHGESTVSMSDPALDGLFARYADLHRDAVGYAVTDVVEGTLYAKAVPDTAAPITR